MSQGRGPILLTGAHGQVGGQLLPLLQPLGEVVAPTRAELDLSDADALRAYVRQLQPRWIVNPAAYTAVDKAESEPEVARAINAEAPRVLGEEAEAMGAAVIHFSTDYVFAGNGERPWTESDATGPLGVYGETKLAGERALAESGAAYMIFRTSWVYGAGLQGTGGKNFLLTILRLAREREELKVVADQHGAPTWSQDLARLTVHAMERSEAVAQERGVSLVEAVRSLGGVYHACDAGETSWFGFAKEFVSIAQAAEPEQRFARLVPIETAEYPTPAKRPGNSRMNCERLQRELGFVMPDWRDSTRKVMEQVLAARQA